MRCRARVCVRSELRPVGPREEAISDWRMWPLPYSYSPYDFHPIEFSPVQGKDLKQYMEERRNCKFSRLASLSHGSNYSYSYTPTVSVPDCAYPISFEALRQIFSET